MHVLWTVLDARRPNPSEKVRGKLAKDQFLLANTNAGFYAERLEYGVDVRSIRQNMESRILIEMAENIGEDRNTVRSNHKILLGKDM